MRAALLVLALGFLALWLAGGDGLCGFGEGSPALWPPGATECVYETRPGVERTETYVPWRWWLGFAATGVAGGIALTLTRRP